MYRSVDAPLNPVIPDLVEFEAAVCNIAEAIGDDSRPANSTDPDQVLSQLALGRIALLLSCVATGINYSDMGYHDRIQAVRTHSQLDICLRKL